MQPDSHDGRCGKRSSAAVLDITAEPPTALRCAGALLAGGTWLWQKRLHLADGGHGGRGSERQIHAHVCWHVVSSAVAAALMAWGRVQAADGKQ